MLRWWLPWLADIYAAESYKGTLLKKTSWFHETGHSLEKWCFITGNPTKWVDYFRPVIWVHPDTGYTHCIYDVHGVWTYVRSSRRLQGYVPIEAPCKAGLAMLKIRLCSAKIGLMKTKTLQGIWKMLKLQHLLHHSSASLRCDFRSPTVGLRGKCVRRIPRMEKQSDLSPFKLQIWLRERHRQEELWMWYVQSFEDVWRCLKHIKYFRCVGWTWKARGLLESLKMLLDI